ncbi:MAG: 3-deoxy-7-phosphoheptulonate synthase [Bacteroidetes bacterium]|jgi:3-deoxy-7-phosphoheptulonate synthase|nr:3-deoxy-7-phosphoheptulonate synthase [Bacteroidota bacterium]
MLVVMKADATSGDVDRVQEKIRLLGLVPHKIPGAERVAIGITGNRGGLDPDLFQSMTGVLEAVRVSKPFKLVSREVKPDDSVIQCGTASIGGPELAVIAGPCSVESRQQIIETAEMLAETGVRFLRGGAFKPRTSPYAFQGLKEQGLEYLREAADRTGMKVVTEVKDTESLPEVLAASDILQVGARNMFNFSLLERLGDERKPVLLKRSFAATIEEWLMAAEYLASRGNYEIILCERGIRTFEPSTRNTLDLNAVPLLKKLSHLPVLVDPSHGTGRWDLVIPMAQAAVVAGADGLMIEVHLDPASALSDGYQSLRPETFRTLMARLHDLVPFVKRRMPVAAVGA